MLTRCPACGTTFRLRPEQIAKAQGRVRCGKCSIAFSAVDNRIDGSGETDLPAPAADVILPPLPTATPQFSAQRKRFLAQRDTAAAPAAEPDALHDEDITLPPEQPDAVAPEQPPPEKGTPEPQAAAAPEPAPHEALETAKESVAGESAEPAQDEDTAEGRDESEARAPEAPDYLAPAAPSRRWPWLLGTLLLGAALAMQIVYAYRSDIAKHHPEWRPRLEAICHTFGCVVELPRDADQVSIESSELNPQQDKGRLRLEAHLKNRAAYAQAYPDLELTLTDVRDQPVLRRVFEPRDYLPADAAASFAANGEIVIGLLLDVGEITASGYRVYVFYP